MDVAYDVIGLYVLLAVWAVALIVGLRRRSFGPFFGLGLLLAVMINGRYFIEGPPDAIAFFIGIYDTFDNIGLDRTEGAPALATCVDNACTVWGDRYVNHPSWGVAFHDRFTNSTSLRTGLLYAHIGLNTVALLLMHYQLWRPGTGANRDRHRLLGKLAFGMITLGTIAAIGMASEHSAVTEYGGIWAELGFYSMSAVVWLTGLAGVVTARRGDVGAHRIWMIRHLGAMWGAFWLFRVMLVFTGPLFRSWESASILTSIWFSAPLGVLIAEYFRVRYQRQRHETSASTKAAVAAG